MRLSEFQENDKYSNIEADDKGDTTKHHSKSAITATHETRPTELIFEKKNSGHWSKVDSSGDKLY